MQLVVERPPTAAIRLSRPHLPTPPECCTLPVDMTKGDVMLSERESLGWSTRRQVWNAAALATAIALGGALPEVALSQAGYPDKPIRLVVGQGSGGPSDTIAHRGADDVATVQRGLGED